MTPSAETGALIVDWDKAGTMLVRDGLGRSFKWSELKGKTVFICGHGEHHMADGYVTVPKGTTLNFYQTYGRSMVAWNVYKLINTPGSFETERSFTAGQSCPNMTLLDDDGSNTQGCIADTNAAIRQRLQGTPDQLNYFNFNCNQFQGLPRYVPKPGYSTAFLGKQVLKLSQILPLLAGNTIEWACCQDVIFNKRKLGENYGRESEILAEQRAVSRKAADNPNAAFISGFSPTVQTALRAADAVSAKIRANQLDPTYIRSVSSVHVEGAGSRGLADRSTTEYFVLNKNRSGASGAPMGKPTSREQELTNLGALIEAATKWRDEIRIGITALITDPQPDPFHRSEIKEKLERSLRVAESYLRELSASLTRVSNQ